MTHLLPVYSGNEAVRASGGDNIRTNYVKAETHITVEGNATEETAQKIGEEVNERCIDGWFCDLQ